MRIDSTTNPDPRSVAQRPIVTIGWMAHWVLRMALIGMLIVYGWTKVFLVQMGVADYSSALVRYGEMSPMGLLWRFMEYSEPVQIAAGAAEVLACLLLVWRRTAWLGALLGAADMAVVFALNLFFDVPVKQLALALFVGFLLLLIPDVPRLVRIVAGRAAPAAPLPRAIPWPRIHRVTRILGPVLGLALVLGSGAAIYQSLGIPAREPTPVSGVYRVTQDARPPARQLAVDPRWSQVAFGSLAREQGSPMSVRTADGGLRYGWYRLTPSAPDGSRGTIEADLGPRMGGPANPGTSGTQVQLTYERGADGTLRLSGAGEQLVLSPDAEARFLFDRGYSWEPRQPVNR
ncbi:putative membrane protein YphA (DoxX/SURF4 family) [Kineosphaera limosa]|uniref:DoxX family protein n=1 Tax=Kineosphaera limosa NBRC 100340 TaxID=1184609 RepID=K6WW56_9MICO|nr:hypothetical protein [Kineosphaera limosa]NYE00140.1 putative membrane protein YphA (DoxX/SURF4 family) [Kineosphaera limosa]GAB98071.1 hypothetical protein KILIM_098_00100 [Kineosphaera limosa NBRC 100340]